MIETGGTPPRVGKEFVRRMVARSRPRNMSSLAKWAVVVALINRHITWCMASFANTTYTGTWDTTCSKEWIPWIRCNIEETLCWFLGINCAWFRWVLDVARALGMLHVYGFQYVFQLIYYYWPVVLLLANVYLCYLLFRIVLATRGNPSKPQAVTLKVGKDGAVTAIEAPLLDVVPHAVHTQSPIVTVYDDYPWVGWTSNSGPEKMDGNFSHVVAHGKEWVLCTLHQILKDTVFYRKKEAFSKEVVEIPVARQNGIPIGLRLGDDFAAVRVTAPTSLCKGRVAVIDSLPPVAFMCYRLPNAKGEQLPGFKLVSGALFRALKDFFLITHGISAVPGSSGAPLMVEAGVFAVHSHGANRPNGTNLAQAVTAARFAALSVDIEQCIALGYCCPLAVAPQNTPEYLGRYDRKNKKGNWRRNLQELGGLSYNRDDLEREDRIAAHYTDYHNSMGENLIPPEEYEKLTMEQMREYDRGLSSLNHRYDAYPEPSYNVEDYKMPDFTMREAYDSAFFLDRSRRTAGVFSSDWGDMEELKEHSAVQKRMATMPRPKKQGTYRIPPGPSLKFIESWQNTRGYRWSECNLKSQHDMLVRLRQLNHVYKPFSKEVFEHARREFHVANVDTFEAACASVFSDGVDDKAVGCDFFAREIPEKSGQKVSCKKDVLNSPALKKELETKVQQFLSGALPSNGDDIGKGLGYRMSPKPEVIKANKPTRIIFIPPFWLEIAERMLFRPSIKSSMLNADHSSVRPGMTMQYGGATTFVRSILGHHSEMVFESDFSEMDLHDSNSLEYAVLEWWLGCIMGKDAAVMQKVYKEMLESVFLIDSKGDSHSQYCFGSGRYVTSYLQSYAHLLMFLEFCKSQAIPFSDTFPNVFGDDGLHGVPKRFDPSAYRAFLLANYGQVVKEDFKFGDKLQLFRDKVPTFLSYRFLDGELATIIPVSERLDKMVFTYMNSSADDAWHAEYARGMMVLAFGGRESSTKNYYEFARAELQRLQAVGLPVPTESAMYRYWTGAQGHQDFNLVIAMDSLVQPLN